MHKAMLMFLTLFLTLFPTLSPALAAVPTGAQTAVPALAQAGAAAQIPPRENAPQACDSSQLLLLANSSPSADAAQPSLFRLGETLQISLRDACAAQLTQELAQREAVDAVQLRLDNVAMAKLPVTVSQGANLGELILAFHLVRVPQEAENRTSWDQLLGKKHKSFVMPLPVALTIGAKPAYAAYAAQSPSPFRFYVATGKQVFWTAGLCLLLFFASFSLLVASPSALRDSRHGLYSLGKSQMAFWGLLVMLSFAGVWLLTGAMERIPEQVLILLGISGATGLSAIVIGNNKQANQAAANARPRATQGFWRDICNDGNGLSFHRMQVVAWTIFLGLVFVRAVVNVMSMPEFPETLLVLMGISNGVYLGFKIPEQS